MVMAMAGCTGTVEFSIDGSSTVYPIAEAWASEVAKDGILVSVSLSGTGGGFTKFCRGETQISDASRPIKDTEAAACASNGIEPMEFTVATDGLAVVVATSNSFVDHLTVEELNKIWTADSSKQMNTWKDVRDEWPDQKIDLFGPGTNSGTFDYFIEVIIHPFDGSETKGRSDYTPSEDDNVLVQGVAGSQYALGYFGLAYARENADRLRIVPIDEGEGDGPVLPSDENVESGKYSPLSRPLFMYTAGTPQAGVRAFLEFGLSPEGQQIVSEVGYVKMPEATRLEMLEKLG
jgi:phosphate transport system substrate-binding protein